MTPSLQRPLVVLAGEPSGDRLAARVVARLPGARVFGIGGEALASTGARLTARTEALAAMGLGDALGRLVPWALAVRRLLGEVERERPGIALLVDTPEIGRWLAPALRRRGCQVLQYVAPQVWAWRRGRLATVPGRLDALAVILPFEEALWRDRGVPVRFVGHPLLDEPPPARRSATREALGVGDREPLVALLPGSRPGELRRHLPLLGEVARRLAASGVRTRLAPPPATSDALRARDLLAAADGALVCSGTATLEAAQTRTPLAVFYRPDRLTALLAPYLVRAPWIGLPSWIAGRAVTPELVGAAATPEALAAAALALLDPETAAGQRRDLDEVSRRLGPPGAAARVAGWLRELDDGPPR